LDVKISFAFVSSTRICVTLNPAVFVYVCFSKISESPIAPGGSGIAVGSGLTLGAGEITSGGSLGTGLALGSGDATGIGLELGSGDATGTEISLGCETEIGVTGVNSPSAKPIDETHMTLTTKKIKNLGFIPNDLQQ
jgi:hypothetical protein